MEQEYGYAVEVPEGYDEAVVRARLALKGEGFSILTESHIEGLLGPDTSGDRQYLFIGAWNTSLEQTIDTTPPADASGHTTTTKVSLHLPCNVVVQETGSSAIVAALDPADTMDGDESIEPELAGSARAALSRALERIAGK